MFERMRRGELQIHEQTTSDTKRSIENRDIQKARFESPGRVTNTQNQNSHRIQEENGIRPGIFGNHARNNDERNSIKHMNNRSERICQEDGYNHSNINLVNSTKNNTNATTK